MDSNWREEFAERYERYSTWKTLDSKEKVKSFFIKQFNELTDDLSDKKHVEIITNSDDVTFRVAKSTLDLITHIDFISIRINGEAFGEIKFDNGALLYTEKVSFTNRPRINDVVVDHLFKKAFYDFKM
ncbi:hypothetical protein HC660_17710 [Bacillus mojavensis]|uniref:Uncharacterized protein n=1 Tax=Bacillus mojavensis TaxID=72360 RepID=A0ABX6LWW4_BACMO|nr:hypothetical protein [Bacillus mojavensis]QJC96247.1 hypothetical protein HC660_17710 [Bacillus mojavensis]